MTTAEIARLITVCETINPHYGELLRPAMRGELNVMALTREVRTLPLRRMERQGRPLAVLVGDDDYCTTGPGGWACAVRLRSWARFAIVHGTGAQRAHYAHAAAMTLKVRRLLFIETSSAAAQDWAGFLRERDPALPFMGLLPAPEGVHPVTPAPGEVH